MAVIGIYSIETLTACWLLPSPTSVSAQSCDALFRYQFLFPRVIASGNQECADGILFNLPVLSYLIGVVDKLPEILIGGWWPGTC